MNYCVPDMYEMPHGGGSGYTMQGGSEYCMYAGEGPGFGHCETQPLHHPPCMEQAWPPSQQPYICSYPGSAPVFKNEFCNMEIPLSHYHQPDYVSEGKPDFSHMQWTQGPYKKGMTYGWHDCMIWNKENVVQMQARRPIPL